MARRLTPILSIPSIVSVMWWKSVHLGHNWVPDQSVLTGIETQLLVEMYFLVDFSQRTDNRLRYCTIIGFVPWILYIPDLLKYELFETFERWKHNCSLFFKCSESFRTNTKCFLFYLVQNILSGFTAIA